MKNNNILIIGSVAIDSIETPFGKRESVLGGSATYSSMSASNFSKFVSIVAVVGKDFPNRYLELFKKRNIDLTGLEVDKEHKTFKWKGDYNYDLNSPRTIYTHLNVFQDFDPKIPEPSKKSRFIFLANIDPDLQNKILSQVRNTELIVLDTINY